jgi:hypothetical protein
MPTTTPETFWAGRKKPANLMFLADGSAAFNGGRSFSRLLLKPLARLRAFAFGASKTATPDQCVLCASGHPDPRRLAQLIGRLPVGRPVTLPVLREALDPGFKSEASDLHFLKRHLKLPVTRSRRRFLLKAPISLCKSCAAIGEQFRNSAGVKHSLNRDTAGNHLMCDRDGESLQHIQAEWRPKAAAPPFPN